ncbi:hypothetical protein A3J20_01580 [Candidatus Gottesmanbacteria bacterium RIFCSPLOWO2_02_FULL_42_29]|nr:MAG: hypothetical protein A2781_03315 [Candidatus Gottesmanbacteria bacterium RIFCSPHIGHO2_01_FULL_42_27]OGG38774.1 MAG: hypothetical protein A3J20_01580 [Candidatus Gottesmanbacteria bacterium RIFCSPLOWO2_02_FULL_42_29]
MTVQIKSTSKKFQPISNWSVEEIKKFNEKVISETEAEYKEFIEDYGQNICYLCKKPFDYFDIKSPCMHWFLRPDGCEKKHFPIIFNNFDCFRIYPYLCWLANTESPFKNINNLAEERGKNKIFETTIKYKNYEWSISCSVGCFKGIHGSFKGSQPHYHFQMKINGKIFISYNDFHINFTDYDLWTIAAQRGEFSNVKYHQFRSMGMQDALDTIQPKILLKGMKATANDKNATYHLQTMVEADEGTSISGDEIADLIKEHNRTGMPMAVLFKRLKNVRAKTIISPGPGVPEMASRIGGRGSKRKK